MQIVRRQALKQDWKIIKTLHFFLIIIALNLRCLTLSTFSQNRAQDMGDILNVGVEENVFGFAFNIDLLLIGWKKDSSGLGYGMRYGNFGKYKTGAKIPLRIRTKDRKIVGYYGDIQFLLGYQSYYHEPIEPKNIRSERKQIRFATLGATGQKTTPPELYLINQARESYCYFPMELSLELYYGIRIGFNPHELVDFFIGFIGFDILDDDIAGIPQPIRQKGNWEEKIDALDVILTEKIPMVSIEKSQYAKVSSDEFHKCYFAHSCVQYEANKYDNVVLEKKCKNESGVFTVNSKCFQKNIIGYCKLPNYEIVYLYNDGYWMLADIYNDCKSLKGKFIR